MTRGIDPIRQAIQPALPQATVKAEEMPAPAVESKPEPKAEAPADRSAQGINRLTGPIQPVAFSDPMTGFMVPVTETQPAATSTEKPTPVANEPSATLTERLVTEGGSNAASALENAPKAQRAAQGAGTIADGVRRLAGNGPLAKMAEPVGRALQQAADLAGKMPPAVGAVSRLLTRAAPVLSAATATFDTARAVVEPNNSPKKTTVEGQAAVSIASATASTLALGAGVLATGVAGAAVATVAAPVAVVATVGAVALGVGAVVDNWAFGGRGQAWVGRGLRNLTGRNPLFG